MTIASSISARRAHDPEDCADACLIAQAVAGLSVGLVLLDPAGKVVWVNRAAEPVLGVPVGQCVGRPVSRVLKDPRLAAFWQDAASCAGNRLGTVSVRWPRALELKVNATHCLDPRGTLIGRALLFCDVTEDRTVQVRLSQAVADRLLSLTNGDTPPAPVANLTHQELRILRQVGRGLGNRAIADEVGISSATVRSHLKSVYRKLSLASRAEAVSYAIRNQLV